MDSKKLLEVVVKAADDKKALDIVALDMSDVTFVADYFVIMEAMNTRQLDAIADHIADQAELAGAKAAGHIEGDVKSGWVLIDLGDIVVSVFTHDERAHYNLEKLWSDAPLVDVSAFVSE